MNYKKYILLNNKNGSDENVRSARAQVFDLKLSKEFYLAFGIYYKIYSIREKSIGEGKYNKKIDLFY